MHVTTNTAPLGAHLSRDATRAFGDHPRPPSRRPGVSRYRVFMLITFCAVVVADVCAARCLSAPLADVVGATSVAVWAATLLGSFRLGPLGRLRDVIDAVR
ncbi:MAG TPA: hypothetical protein VMU47_05075 [Caldimonas sp.]|nr:hypothetical protein [Caldimonas sp.]